MSTLSSTPEDRTVVQFVRRRRMPATAVAALLAAHLAFGLTLAQIRESLDPLRILQCRVAELEAALA